MRTDIPVAEGEAIIDDKGRTVADLRPAGGGAKLRMFSFKPGSQTSSASINITTSAESTFVSAQDENRMTGVGPGFVSLVTRNATQEGTTWLRNLPTVSLGLTEVGGTIEVRNALGKTVAVVQSSKANDGLVLVSDVNGQLQRSLSVGVP